MPEIPEVEAVRKRIEKNALHTAIDHVGVEDKRVLEVSEQKLWSNVSGHEISEADRHGKYILLKLDQSKWLVVHLGMTGDMPVYDDPDEAPEHARVVLELANGRYLAFDNQRMFGEMNLIEDRDEFIFEKNLGPDALDLEKDEFKDLIHNRRGMIKTALMDQELIAGIGNIYSDEILFQARLHPSSQCDKLGDEHLDRLYNKLNSILQDSTETRIKGDSLPDSYLIPHRSEGEDCPACGGKVQQVSISGRNAYCCPDCQEEVS